MAILRWSEVSGYSLVWQPECEGITMRSHCKPYCVSLKLEARFTVSNGMGNLSFLLHSE